MASLARVKEFKDIEISYDAPSGFTLTFYTDMPGSTLALRKTISFPASTGRRTYTAPLDGVEGTLYYVSAASSGTVRLFWGVLRCRGIGVYFDGTQSEIWRTQPQPIGG